MAKISIRKRGNKFSYSFEATEYTVDGKRKRIEKGGFATKKEAMEAGIAAKANLQRGNVALLSEKVLVKDFVAEWLKMKEREVKPTTLRNYWDLMRPVLPLIGDKSLQKLRPRDINAVIQAIAQKGYSYGTMSKILNTMKDAFSYAVFPAELIQANPAQYIKVPKGCPKKVIERVIIRQDKLEELLNAYPFGHPYHLPIVIAYHTGMRLGEVRGLTWEDVDLKQGRINVVRQIAYTIGKGHYFTSPKTITSCRSIPIDDELIAILRRQKAQQAENELKKGRAYFYTYEGGKGTLWQISKAQPPGEGMIQRQLVCTTVNGKVISKSALTYVMKKHGVNFHSLRHTHATLCAENGASPKGLAGRLGHSNTRMTEDLYTHETEIMQESAKAAFLGALAAKK